VSRFKRNFRTTCGIGLLWAATAIALSAQTLTTLHNFGSSGTDGQDPVAGLIQGADGNFYGTTQSGDVYPYGTVFKITPSGTTTTLYGFCSLTGCTDGLYSLAGLAPFNGNFYGTTSGGGTNNLGTVFEITPGGALTTLHSFDVSDGEYPYAGLILGANGNLYSTTQQGGANFYYGSIFEITPGGALTTVLSFDPEEGEFPIGGLVQATNWSFYGTTQVGGTNGCGRTETLCGTIFEITPGGTLTTLHSFDGTDGYAPVANLVQGTDGNLYGTTPDGGSNTCFGGANACGTVFKITPSGVLTTLHSFNGTDGAAPQAGLIQATDGNFYGTTSGGGANDDGTIFKITPGGTLTTLYNFDFTDGEIPVASLIQGTSGNFYGTTSYGGTYQAGTVFSLSVGLRPFVQTSPNFGYVGTSVQILGNNLTGTTSITFNGTPQPAFTVVSSTEIITTVPVGATSGKVQVVAPGRTLSSYPPFRVITSPTMTTAAATSVTALGAVLNGRVNPQGTAGYAGFYWGTDPTLTNSIFTCTTWTSCPSVAPNSTPQPFNAPLTGLSSGTTYYFEMAFWDTYTNTYWYGSINSFTTKKPTATTSTPTSVTALAAVLNGDVNPQGLSGYAGFYWGTDPTLTSYTLSCSSWTSCPAVAPNSTPQPFNASLTGLLNGTTYYFEMVYWDTNANIYWYGSINSFTTKNPTPTTTAATSVTPFQAVLNGKINPWGLSGYAGFYWGTDPTLTTYTLSCATWTACPSVMPNSSSQPFNFALTGLNGSTTYYFEMVYWDTNTNTYWYGSINSFVAFTTLHKFDLSDGADPLASLVQGTDGNLYGTTSQGGTNGVGTVFKITPNGLLTTLYNFCPQSGCADGSGPSGQLVQGTDGDFYGTTYAGGAANSGTVFKITLGGALTTLYSFCAKTGCADGDNPAAGLIQADDGNLYGTTEYGGTNNLCGLMEIPCGTVFEITPSGTLTTLHNFDFTDGFAPVASLIQAADGNFYGTTSQGGANGDGTAFKIAPGGALTTLYAFCSEGGSASCTDGSFPNAALIQAADGNFYGTTIHGGANNDGTVFEISSTPPYVLTTLHSFDLTDGATPYAGLIQATDGNFYGAALQGGDADSDGTIFEITSTSPYTMTTLHSFDVTDGAAPRAPLVQGTNGNLYGTTYFGGNAGDDGTIFSLSIGLGPFVKTNPTTGAVGSVVVILGTNLTGATSVTFNGTPATFTVKSKTEITTTVPSGATTGAVQVVTPTGTLSSNVPFTVD
jgi:uncharacterized repeat protein (TIGR03803 family)